MALVQQFGFAQLVARLVHTARALGARAHFFVVVRPLGAITLRLTRPRLPREPGAALCELVLRKCVAIGAQELHFAAGVVRVRRHAAWADMMRLPLAFHAPLVDRLRAMANLDLGGQPPQEGELHIPVPGREVMGILALQRMANGTEEARVRFPTASAVSIH